MGARVGRDSRLARARRVSFAYPSRGSTKCKPRWNVGCPKRATISNVQRTDRHPRRAVERITFQRAMPV
jgi:hypothetical protein